MGPGGQQQRYLHARVALAEPLVYLQLRYAYGRLYVMLCYVIGYAMLCHVMLWYVRYVMVCYVNCVDCQFYRGASGTLRATRHAAELEYGERDRSRIVCLSVCLTESDGTRCET